jgi:CDP-glucose 4,6-dehydratase
VNLLVQHSARIIVLDQHTLRPRVATVDTEADIVACQGDIRDFELVRNLLVQHDVQLVFHLAAQPLIPVAHQQPADTLATNVLGTWTVLEAVRASGRDIGVIFASSGAYYGATALDTPIPETAAPNVITNVYAASKIAADVTVQAYARAFGLKTATCRFMNTYGPGDDNVSRIIPRAIRLLLSNEAYDFGDREDGTSRLSYLHVRDMAAAYLAVASRLDAVAGEVFNFGTSELLETRAIVELVSRLFDGVSREPRFAGPHRGVAKRLDFSKAERNLEWRPRIDLATGLAETIAWYRTQWSTLEAIDSPAS